MKPPPPDAEAQERTAAMAGEAGEEAQFRSIQRRTQELIEQSFGFLHIIPASGAAVVPGEQPLIFSTR